MTLTEAATALLLGLLEGATEFIPVSSTGHLVLASHFLGFSSPNNTFQVVIQLGAVLAIVIAYTAKLAWVFGAAPRDPAARRFIGLPKCLDGPRPKQQLLHQVLLETSLSSCPICRASARRCGTALVAGCSLGWIQAWEPLKWRLRFLRALPFLFG